MKGISMHTMSKLYDVPVGFPPHLRQCIALFAVDERWMLLHIGWSVLILHERVAHRLIDQGNRKGRMTSGSYL